jgi:glycosyltransferase involved in cell wall biosynthesis
MHNLTKIKLFRIAAWISFPFACIFIYPLVLLKKKKRTHLFFFLDRYAMGGAQRVHLDILQALADTPKQVYFTRKSLETSLKDEFYSVPNTESCDVHFWCDNLLLRLFSVHYFAFYVNRHKGAHAFSSNSTFFYDVLPFFASHVHTTELLHNFTFGNRGMEFFGLANYKYLTTRIVIDASTLSNIKKQYEQHGISEFMERVLLIEPGVDIPPYQRTAFSLPLKVLYAGRGGPQKRIHLINEVAEYCIQQQLPVAFHFAGTMMNELSQTVRSHAVLHGQISGQQRMYELYQSCHAILMTSAYEGFPMLIKESMACGCIPVVTALPGNKTHLQHGLNSLLINAVEDERMVVKLAIEQVTALVAEKGLVERLSRDCYDYATLHFGKEKFIEAYRRLLLPARFNGN